MNFSNLFKIALRALYGNKLRGFLTMLGIIIGVAAVITMLAIGQGSQQSINEQISSMGSNIIYVRPGTTQFGGVRQSSSTMQTLKVDDYDAIRKYAKYLAYVSPEVSASGQVMYGGNNTPTSAQGGNESYGYIRGYNVKDGNWFTEHDVKVAAKVCLVGKTVANNLFKDGEDPIGSIIRFKNIPLRVIGLLEEKGYSSMGMDQDDMIILPYTTIQKRILAITYVQSISGSVVSEELTNNAIDDVTHIVRQQHKIKQGDEDDFNVRSMQEILKIMTSTTNIMTMLLAFIASISLLVGGIGIMNIMYVSVKERTREIGLRMAIGAKGSAIMMQFLIESVLLSVVGGIIGILLGMGCSYVIKSIIGWAITVQPFTVAISFLVCTFTGVFFGWYPARSAANLDPIDALRYE